MGTKDTFRDRVETFIGDSGIDPTTFGREVMKDPNFVFDLRKGRTPNAATMDRVSDWMDANKATYTGRISGEERPEEFMARSQARPFENIYAHGFVRVAAATPRLDVARPDINGTGTIDLARKADANHAGLVVFPELGLSAYSNDDLFFQDALLDAVEDAAARLIEESARLMPVILAGAPVRADGRLFNAALVIHRGCLLGVVPKSYLPNYREFYERRQFTPAQQAVSDEVTFAGQSAPFGTNLLFVAGDCPDFVLHAEICEDVWVPVPPSAFAAMAGATVLANLSASNITVGKTEYRNTLCKSHSGRCMAAYIYSAAGPGESTTDMAWDGHAMIYENGALLAETGRFPAEPQIAYADVDVERLRQERMRHGTFSDCGADYREKVAAMRRIGFDLSPPRKEVIPLARAVDRFPFVPSNADTLHERCFEAYNIQVHGLKKRMQAAGLKKIVIGVSGGLDSTQALLVAAKTMDELDLPRKNILAYTMPGFATSKHTRDNAWTLMKTLGVTGHEIDIRPVSEQTLKDIGHPFSRGEKLYDVTFENVQAGARTATLFRLANRHGGLVLGTGDLSELALGWCTYGVGDHMSHYNVNASVPKTLIQHLIRWVIVTAHFGQRAQSVLQSILETEISPELVPGEGDGPAQRTEDIIGPYELQDFNLFYITRHSLRPSKVAYLSWNAWRDRMTGTWPEHMAEEARNEYILADIKKWLELFLFRFFQTSQFKRSALPNGPKVGSGGSLSPRGDWRAPSDSSADVWLEELRRNVPEEVA